VDHAARVHVCESADGDWMTECLLCDAWVYVEPVTA
jgi:hypothetical protein